MSLHNFLDPQGQLPAALGAWMSTRHGGCSDLPFDSLNLGDHVGDDPAKVQANRQRLAKALGVQPVFLRQVHGSRVIELEPGTPDGTEADACFTFAPGLACTIMVADCLPVLMWDRGGQWVAAAHAGWRGLAGQGGTGVLETPWAALTAKGAQARDTQVWLGPCIGRQAFEVGPEVRAAFGPDRPAVAAAFSPASGDRWLADLPALARGRLQRLGLRAVLGHEDPQGWCTVSNPGLFFSHRRDALRLGSTGRMAACVWRR